MVVEIYLCHRLSIPPSNAYPLCMMNLWLCPWLSRITWSFSTEAPCVTCYTCSGSPRVILSILFFTFILQYQKPVSHVLQMVSAAPLSTRKMLTLYQALPYTHLTALHSTVSFKCNELVERFYKCLFLCTSSM